MEIDLRLLQLAVESENTVENVRKTLTKAVEFFSTLPGNKEKVENVFRDLRGGLDLSKLEEKDIFVVDPDMMLSVDVPEEFKAFFLGLFSADQKYCVYSGRLVYPVRDVYGNVMGLCGWDPVDKPKYLDSSTYGYNAKRNSMYGMEKLKEYYKSKDSVFITEGIVDCNYLRVNGFNSLALLGSSISKYVAEILRRFGRRCIFLIDWDEAGQKMAKFAKLRIPESRSFVSIIDKDIDDTRKKENHMYESELLSELRALSNPNNIFFTTRILRMVN